MTRKKISSPMEGASPHMKEAMTNRKMASVNSRTWPKRRVSQPVSGTEIAFATPNEVMTQVPWSGETPRSPEIAGIDTFAIDVSSTFMKIASDSARVPSSRAPPCSGGIGAGVFTDEPLCHAPRAVDLPR
jgi:hypothetical protein